MLIFEKKPKHGGTRLPDFRHVRCRRTFKMSELKIWMSAGFRSSNGLPLPLGLHLRTPLGSLRSSFFERLSLGPPSWVPPSLATIGLFLGPDWTLLGTPSWDTSLIFYWIPSCDLLMDFTRDHPHGYNLIGGMWNVRVSSADIGHLKFRKGVPEGPRGLPGWSVPTW